MQNNDNLSALELQARILNLKKELDQKSKIEMMAALESSQQPANFNYLISYQGNRFSYLDKNQLMYWSPTFRKISL